MLSPAKNLEKNLLKYAIAAYVVYGEKYYAAEYTT